MPSFLKKSSSGESDSAGTLKWVEASWSTSLVVCSSVRIREQSTIRRGGRKGQQRAFARLRVRAWSAAPAAMEVQKRLGAAREATNQERSGESRRAPRRPL